MGLTSFARGAEEGEGGAADEQQRAANNASLIRNLPDTGVSDHNPGLWLNVKRAVSDHATGSGHQNTNEEEESLQLLSFERGLALLEECADAFVLVFRRETERKKINFAA